MFWAVLHALNSLAQHVTEVPNLAELELHACPIVGDEVTGTLKTACLLRPPPHCHRSVSAEITGF